MTAGTGGPAAGPSAGSGAGPSAGPEAGSSAGPAGGASAGASARTDWAGEAQRLLAAFQAAAADPQAAADHSAECRYCPLCQGIAVLRRTGPDVLDRVAELAAGFAATLRAAAAADDGPADRAPGDAAAGAPASAPGDAAGVTRYADLTRTEAPAFVRIDVTD